jgi:serine/threonine protein kinase
MINRHTIPGIEILKELGKGGMADVYLAKDVSTGNYLALKVLKKMYAADENIRKRFVKEARQLIRLRHPGIISGRQLIDRQDLVAYTMNYLPGADLGKRLNSVGKLDHAQSKNIILQVLEALKFVHREGIIHRDIKPSNIMLSTGEHVRLIDLGIAKIPSDNDFGKSVTTTDAQMGTPTYMSPEQIKSTKSVGIQSDIYSVGVVLWQMITGQAPYGSDGAISRFDLQKRIVEQPLPKTDTAWDKVIQKATQKDPGRRYRNAQEMIDGIESMMEASPVLGPQIHEWVKALAIIVCFAIVPLLYFSIYYSKTIKSGLVGKLVLVNGGKFKRVGDTESKVTLSDYYIGETEVTLVQWRAVMGSSPPNSKFNACDQCPVEGVSWNDVQEFIKRLNNRSSGIIYRLPTEAEWEYAARGGVRSKGYHYSGSNNPDEVAWHISNSGGRSRPVKGKKPNELGLYDMSGSVYEWCSDWYGSYHVGSQTNPSGPKTGSNRVNRGGSWNSSSKYCNVGYRSKDVPDYRSVVLGFRLASTP